MGTCPFCQADINEEILLYGGRCPSCFNDIPGEEAPTDPGAQARANADLEAQITQKRSRAPLMVGAAMALVLLVGGGWYLTHPAQAPLTEMPEIVINNDLSGHINLDIPGTDPEVEAAQAVAHAASGAAKAPPTGGQVSARVSSASTPQQSTVASVTPRPSGLDLDIGVSLNPGAAMPQQKVLSSEEEIQAMIAKSLGSYTSRLQGCYNSRLKEKEDLQGTWQVSFNITTTGKTANIAVSARNDADAPLEDCLRRQVERFSFQKIARDRPISVPLRFGT